GMPIRIENPNQFVTPYTTESVTSGPMSPEGSP
uniref:Rabphilin-3A-interacting PROTEIN=BETA-adducin homolog (Fragments) n=1 Tax=Bos taurus TaxID=9913 RepID=Q9TS72_BOVIN